MNILIVEDDSSIRRGLADHFQNQGWKVDEAMDGQLGLKLSSNGSYDLIVLDIMLPQVNGYEICKALRVAGKETPIIMLTAKSSEQDVLQGFNVGATDYVRKPFSLAELTARVRSHLPNKESSIIEYAHFSLDPNTRRLIQAGESIDLTDKEASVLAHLVNNRGKVLTREQILNHAWGNTYMQSTRSVDRCVKTLRKKLTEDIIITIRQVGYMIE